MKTSEKLNKLADFLATEVDDSNFDYSSYGRKATHSTTNWSSLTPPQHICGTVGCAAGWAQECFNETFWEERFHWYTFNEKKFVKFMDFDEQPKLVEGNRDGLMSTDYELIFADDDDRLSLIYGSMSQVPKSAVIARLREAADEYAAKDR